jgi:uncharacterized damage-inducible protein DinB
MADPARRGTRSPRKAHGAPARSGAKAHPPRAREAPLRRHLLWLLDSGDAHARFEDVFRAFPEELRRQKPAGSEHTAWQLLEHLRIAQWDILEFSRDREHVSPKFPEGYWPSEAAPPGAAAWRSSLAAFAGDLAAMKALVRDPRTDLFARIPHGSGQTILREVLLVADHNAYHLGQVVELRRRLGCWPPR